MDAEAKASAAGTPQSTIERCKSHEFLLECLQRGVQLQKYDQELLQDIADACEINELHALTLGSGLLTVSEASEQLFLMPSEASAILDICRKQLLRAGVNFGDGATADGLEDEEPPPPKKPAGIVTPPNNPVPTPSPAPAAHGTLQLPKQEASSTPAGQPGDAKSSAVEPSFFVKPPLAGPDKLTVTATASPKHPVAAPAAASNSHTKAPVPRARAPTTTSSDVHTPPAPRPRLPSASAASNTPSTTTPATRGRTRPVSAHTPSSNAATPTSDASPATYANRPQSARSTQTPSYAKATSSVQSRYGAAAAREANGGERDLETSSASRVPPVGRGTLRASMAYNPRPMSALDSEKREPKKPVFDKIRSSLLKPTKAFLAWSAGKTKEATDQEKTPMGKVTSLSQSVPKPFSLSENRSSRPRPLTSEEMQLQEVHAFKARPAPRFNTSTRKTAEARASPQGNGAVAGTPSATPRQSRAGSLAQDAASRANGDAHAVAATPPSPTDSKGTQTLQRSLTPPAITGIPRYNGTATTPAGQGRAAIPASTPTAPAAEGSNTPAMTTPMAAMSTPGPVAGAVEVSV